MSTATAAAAEVEHCHTAAAEVEHCHTAAAEAEHCHSSSMLLWQQQQRESIALPQWHQQQHSAYLADDVERFSKPIVFAVREIESRDIHA